MAAAAAMPAQASAQAAPAGANDQEAPTTLGAEQMTGRPDREIILERNVEVTRGPTVLNADKATYDIVEDRIEAAGNVRVRRAGDVYTGDELDLKLDTGQGYVLNPTYRLERGNAQGAASRIDFLSREEAVIQQGTYSTCEAPDPDWYLKSSRLNLDIGREVGSASGAVVYFKGVPILGSPFISFPLTEERKSGVLPPTIGITSKGGLELQVPYYFNIAPNRDLTLFPRLYSKRGPQLGAHGRYLGETYSGDTKLEFMPNDRLTGEARYAFSSAHVQRLTPRLTFTSDINGASDDEYPNDFPSTLTLASQRLLLRDAGFNYAGSSWSAGLRASSYQVLQDPRVPIGRPYDRLPQLTFLAGRQDVNGFDWSVNSELTRFWHPDLVRADRMVVQPRLSYPILSPGYFVTPSISMHASTYSLSNQATGAPASFSRVLPTFSLDSGLIFERDGRFFGRDITQTLEPRLYYVYTPFKDQSAFPSFDTALADFNFSQLFSENRFTGNDRISDANQLTAAVVSRFIEESGAERMRFALAQRFYFNEQRVAGAAGNVPGISTGGVPGSGRSDILLAASGQVSRALALETSIQYGQSTRSVSRSTYGVRWQPKPMHVLNAQYRRDVPASLELVDVSAQWPLSSRWYGVGRINYSLRDSKVAEGVVGLEYKADCWVFRLVGQQRPTATGVTSSALFIQLELNGLSRIGSNPMEVLRNNIPGYQVINQP
ncbi:MAG: LPS-assembly protein LptD [Noviherbaspirillum sp.]